jgi:hypothetical protein
VSAVAFERSVAIVGGCGHVGLPLGLALAARGMAADAPVVDISGLSGRPARL